MEGRFTQLLAPRDPATAFGGPEADLSPFQGDQGGVPPRGRREAQGVNTGICTKKGHRRQSMTFFRGDSRIRTGDPLLAKQVLYQLSYTPEGVPGTPVKACGRHKKSRAGVRLFGRPWQS